MSPIFALVAAVTFGFLQQCDAVDNCTFMEYYCTLRQYESYFFEKLHKEPTADCGLQFWNLYYLYLKKAETCLGSSKKLDVANVKEIELLYCSGFDLEVPLVFSLSPCSDTHKIKVDQCLKEFATTFSNDTSDSSLCRERDKAKVCVVAAWQTICQYSAIADVIYNKVIGDFNPFCSDKKDPMASGIDLCADYSIPYRDPKCGFSTNYNIPTKKGNTASEYRGPSSGTVLGISIISCYMYCCSLWCSCP